MSDDIRELDPGTVERIAAGEVVERPASVVKELLENSLDAGADRVDVEVESGGKAGIVVADDGAGMAESEVRKAVEKHTTSKIRDVADLESGLATLGFRGEALHAIGAVSRMTITTRPQGGERGTELRVEGGEVTSVEPAGRAAGTTVEVRDLFYNVPARRKYLKRDATEFAHVNTVVTSYALANPDVRVSLTHDDRETFATTGQDDRRAAVLSVYGREVASSMLPVEADAAALPDGPLDGVSGLVSHPETTRSSREYLSTYVNGRYVTASVVRDAVVDAYGTQLAPDRYPFAVLFLKIPATEVDVNVHPRKLEVRFADEAGAREQIRTAVESALLEEGLLRSGAPRGASAPDQAEINPERDADSGSTRATTAASDPAGKSTADSGAAPPAGGSDTTDGRSDTTDGRSDTTDGRSDTTGGAGRGASEASADRESVEANVGRGSAEAGTGSEPTEASADSEPSEAAGGDEPNGTAGASRTADSRAAGSASKFEGEHEQARLGGEGPEQESFDALPSMQVLGQFRETYLVAETDDGLVLVDQHAADERINYERLREAFAGDVTTQALAEPVELSLTAREAALFDAYGDALASLGFRAERIDERAVEVRTVPSLVAAAADPALLRDALAAVVEGEDEAAETVEAAADELLADLACYPSITGNTSLTEGSMRDLLRALDDCENPWACPHGRPVLIHIDSGEIDDRFERDYPGH